MDLNSSVNLVSLLSFSPFVKLRGFCLLVAIARFWFADVYLSIGGGKLSLI